MYVYYTYTVKGLYDLTHKSLVQRLVLNAAFGCLNRLRLGGIIGCRVACTSALVAMWPTLGKNGKPCLGAILAQAVFYACVGKGDSTNAPKIVGSRYSDIGVARIVREHKLQQGVFDTTELIGLNWSEEL